MITTHVLDTARGRPAEGIHIALRRQNESGEWQDVGAGRTDADGRLRTLVPDGHASPGVYQLTFETKGYFDTQGVRSFYPAIIVTFDVVEGGGHYHVPLLVSPFGYSTYRGS
jgi:5-hydroxyisourate hydrolase